MLKKQKSLCMNPIIEVKKASKKFVHAGKKLQALHEVSFQVEKGDIFGIIGQSGAGKSTLLRSLAKLETLSSGSLFVEGEEITFIKGKQLRQYYKKIGMIFQHFNLLSSRTIEDNIAYPLEISFLPKEKRQQRVDELLELVGLKHKKGAYPSRLSGGEKQRVGIARALANEPHILFCDEATSALDPKTTQEILHLLKTLNQRFGLTIVLITHEMDVIKHLCNKVAILEQGCLVEQGSVIDVFTAPKQSATHYFLQHTIHEIPDYFFKNASSKKRLVRLLFKGERANEPIIAELIKRFQVEANILLGWIDRLQGTTVGNLVIELSGEPQDLERGFSFLKERGVNYEELRR